MVKLMVVHSYHGLPVHNKKYQAIDKHKNLEEYPRNYFELKR